MNCPACSTPMRPYEKSGVEIDVCPSCRGVWLDRGELEKILEAESRHGAPYEAPYGHGGDHDHLKGHHGEHPGHGYSDRHEKQKHCGEHDHEGRYGPHGRRRSFLSDLLGGFGDD